jgi:hypothetical protein
MRAVPTSTVNLTAQRTQRLEPTLLHPHAQWTVKVRSVDANSNALHSADRPHRWPQPSRPLSRDARAQGGSKANEGTLFLLLFRGPLHPLKQRLLGGSSPTHTDTPSRAAVRRLRFLSACSPSTPRWPAVVVLWSSTPRAGSTDETKLWTPDLFDIRSHRTYK